MALVMGVNGNEERYDGNFEEVGSSEGDEHIAALVQAVPQLRTLRLFNYATDLATDAGIQRPTKHARDRTGYCARCVVTEVTVKRCGVGISRGDVETLVMNAGLRQLSKLSKLQHLSLSGSFGGCTLNGLGAALTAMNGNEPGVFAWDGSMLF